MIKTNAKGKLCGHGKNGCYSIPESRITLYSFWMPCWEAQIPPDLRESSISYVSSKSGELLQRFSFVVSSSADDSMSCIVSRLEYVSEAISISMFNLHPADS